MFTEQEQARMTSTATVHATSENAPRGGGNSRNTATKRTFWTDFEMYVNRAPQFLGLCLYEFLALIASSRESSSRRR